MGRFSCTQCGCTYHDKRFAWESIRAEDDCHDGADAGCQPQVGKTLAGKSPSPALAAEAWSDSQAPIEERAQTGTISVASTSCASLAEHWQEDSSDGEISAEDLLAQSASVSGGKESNPPSDGEGSAEDLLARSASASGEDESNPPSDGGGPSCLERTWTDALKGGRVYADVMRAAGTAANVTGAVASNVLHLCQFCSSLSSVAGVVGFSSGLAQLGQGVAPSGAVDPHLVAKGGITTGVGGTCMVLGALASIHPILFTVAIGLGVSGLAAATAVDASVDGLCPLCRRACTPSSAEEGGEQPAAEGAGERFSAGHYELTELLAMRVFGSGA